MQLNIALDGTVGAVSVRRIHRPTHERFADNGVAVGGVDNVSATTQQSAIGDLNVADKQTGVFVRSILLVGGSRALHDGHSDGAAINRNSVVTIHAVEPDRARHRRIRQLGSTGIVESNGLRENRLISVIVGEVRVSRHSEKLSVELALSQRELEGLLTRQNGDGEQRPARVNLSRLSVRSRGRLSDLVEVEHMAITTLDKIFSTVR